MEVQLRVVARLDVLSISKDANKNDVKKIQFWLLSFLKYLRHDSMVYQLGQYDTKPSQSWAGAQINDKIEKYPGIDPL